ncbi:MAG: hypothetical protein IKT38_02370 [Clostridia bacterium]|nr:hypothetical protein [Clostridia bacterium]MBR6509434.1 hypothetical protein [Clostridia bacterium]
MFDILIYLLTLLNLYSIKEVVFTSSAGWFFKAFIIAFSIITAIAIYVIKSGNENRIEYTEEVRQALNLYRQDIERNEEFKKTYSGFNEFYKLFESGIEGREFLFCKLPNEYRYLLSNKLIEEKNTQEFNERFSSFDEFYRWYNTTEGKEYDLLNLPPEIFHQLIDKENKNAIN